MIRLDRMEVGMLIWTGTGGTIEFLNCNAQFELWEEIPLLEFEDNLNMCEIETDHTSLQSHWYYDGKFYED